MTGFVPHRATALDLLADLVTELVAPDAVVLELGAGVGDVAERLLERLPHGRVLALEFDPLLRRIGQERTASLGERISWCAADLTDPSWDHVMPARVDATVTVATLHGLGEDVTRQVYRRVGERLAAGGVLVNLDFVAVPGGHEVGRAMARLTARRNERAAVTAFRTHRDALVSDPVLGPLAEERDRLLRTGERQAGAAEDPPYLDPEHHRQELVASGFRTVDVAWRELDLAMLIAMR